MPSDLNLFQNQFLVTKQKVQTLTNWNQFVIGHYYFYFHPKLKTTLSTNHNSTLLLIGDAYDADFPDKTNQEITSDLNDKFMHFHALLKSNEFSSLAGTYLIFFFCKKDNSICVTGDAAMQRELFYLRQENEITVLGATDKIIGKFFKLKHQNNPEQREFYNSTAFKNKKSFITNQTNFKDLLRLKPNHYLNISTGRTIRYFPYEKIKPIDLDEAALEGSEIMKNLIRAAYHRYKIMIPVSAGWDSRLLLAASKDIRDEVVYYVLQTQSKGARHFDVKVPQKLMSKLNLPFEIIKYPKRLDNTELNIARESISFFRKKNLEYIINYFHKKHANKLTLNGNISEIIRLEFDEIYNLTPQKIAFIQKYPHLPYAISEYENWLEENKSLFSEMGYRALDMLYWEENCANWVSKSKTEFRAYGIEVFSPFNCRKYILTLYGLPKKYRRKQNPVIYKKMIELLWPEVLQVPVNPGLKQIVMRITQYIGIFPIFRNLKLWWNISKVKKHESP